MQTTSTENYVVNVEPDYTIPTKIEYLNNFLFLTEVFLTYTPGKCRDSAY